MSGQIDDVNENDVLEYRRTTELSSTYAQHGTVRAIKTSDRALASIKSLEEVEVRGITGWQRLEREARLPSASCGDSR